VMGTGFALFSVQLVIEITRMTKKIINERNTEEKINNE